MEAPLGVWSLALGVWSLEFGAWSLELGAWRLEFMEFAMLWGRGGGRGPWAGSRTGQPQRSTGSKGQLIRITCAIKMSIRCMMAIVVPRDFCLKDAIDTYLVPLAYSRRLVELAR